MSQAEMSLRLRKRPCLRIGGTQCKKTHNALFWPLCTHRLAHLHTNVYTHKSKNRLKSWLNSLEHWLLFHKTQV